jgi:hypothetical protein
MARAKSIAIYLYALNARGDGNLIQYDTLFSALANMDASATVREVSRGLNFAIDIEGRGDGTDVTNSGDRTVPQREYQGQVIAGSPESSPLFFDYQTGETEEGQTPEGKWLAQVSRIFISVSETYRYVALESVRNGVSPARLATYLGQIAESLLEVGSVEFEMIPVQSNSLKDEIESFERIKSATAVVTRPNYDWSDMSDKLSDLAEESLGHEAEATVRAARNDSLSKSSGIVGTIVSGLDSKSPAIQDFRVTGRKPHADRDTIITSRKHQLRAFARPSPGSSTSEVDSVVFDEASSMIGDQIPSVEEESSMRTHPDTVEGSVDGVTGD